MDLIQNPWDIVTLLIYIISNRIIVHLATQTPCLVEISSLIILYYIQRIWSELVI